MQEDDLSERRKMSIIESADLISEPMIRPGHFFKQQPQHAGTCIATFSGAVYKRVMGKYVCTPVGRSLMGSTVYYLREADVLFYLSPVGSAPAGTTLQDVHAMTGVERFIVFGSCGLLDPSLRGRFLIPAAAFRDEGLSYHYREPSDFIEIPTAALTETFFREKKLNFTSGKTWTTDAIYMETRDKIRKRQESGCVCVEMECSGLQAVCDYLGAELYIYFFAGDVLADDWDPRDAAGPAEARLQIESFSLALELEGFLKQSRME